MVDPEQYGRARAAQLVGNTSCIDDSRPLAGSTTATDWRTESEAEFPADEEIHLWWIDLTGESPPDEPALLDCLSARQRSRWQRLRFPRHRHRYLRAQVGCRRVLGRYLGVAPGAIAYCYGAAGKPELDEQVLVDTGALRFNLTTADDLALLAVARGRPIGVDCEPIRPRQNPHAIARRMFAAEVADAIAELPAREQLHAFHREWTRLEARVKVDGRGLARHREPDLPGLAIGHLAIRAVCGTDYICAVARQRLPAPSDWQLFKLPQPANS